MVEGVMSGQYAVAYLTSSGNPRRAVATEAGAQLLDYNFIGDGTPIWLRGIAIPQESSSPNAAKLLMDCILSAEGQKARSEEHTSELQSLMRISYAVFFLKNTLVQTTQNKHYK